MSKDEEIPREKKDPLTILIELLQLQINVTIQTRNELRQIKDELIKLNTGRE